LTPFRRAVVCSKVQDRIQLDHLLGALEAGRLSRQEVLEEIERHLDRAHDGPVDGALEVVLEELYRTPWDPHLLRILARIYERDGNADGAQRALEMAGRACDMPETAAQRDLDDVGESNASLDDLLLVARLLLSAGFPEQSAVVGERAVAAAPNSLAALNLLAKIRHVQGRLTETIELWHRIHLRSPTREDTVAQLQLLYQLSHADGQAGERFLCVGHDVFARKHDAQVEVERAFASFRARDFAAALSICDRLAARQRTKDRGLYKLAVFQRAWIHERIGDLDAARATLEKLGRERGFETDFERLSFLARICERVGSRVAAKKALHIYQHVNMQYGNLSALPRLSSLHRQLDEEDAARRYDAEYERRFSQRMQRLAPSQTLRALALAYVPLDRVARPRLHADDRSACDLELRLARSPSSRQRREGLLAFLDGELERAASCLRALADRPDASFKDCAYAADVARLRGDADAPSYYARALAHGGAANFVVWQQVLSCTLAEHAERCVAGLDDDRLQHARAALLEAARSAPANADAWRGLALVEQRLGGDTHSVYANKAAALVRTPGTGADIGRVLAAAVYAIGGKPKGVIHEVCATRRRVHQGTGGVIGEQDLLGNLGADFRGLVHLALSIVKDYAVAKWPHLCLDLDDHAYGLRVSKDDEPSSGDSAGLPVAMALMSQLLRKPMPQDIALSGAITCDGRGRVTVRPIGDALFKIKGAYHRDLRVIVLPKANQPEVEATHVIPERARKEIVRFVATLDEAVEVVWGRDAWAW
jgi:tetratricopeptide (TPR) repeat protein